MICVEQTCVRNDGSLLHTCYVCIAPGEVFVRHRYYSSCSDDGDGGDDVLTFLIAHCSDISHVVTTSLKKQGKQSVSTWHGRKTNKYIQHDARPAVTPTRKGALITSCGCISSRVHWQTQRRPGNIAMVLLYVRTPEKKNTKQTNKKRHYVHTSDN